MRVKTWISLISLVAASAVSPSGYSNGSSGCDAAALSSSPSIVSGFPYPNEPGTWIFSCETINQAPVSGFSATTDGTKLTQWNVSGSEQVDTIVISSFSADDVRDYRNGNTTEFPPLQTCLYNYPAGSTSDGGDLALTGINNPNLTTGVQIMACSDGINSVPDTTPPDELITGAEDGCVAEILQAPKGSDIDCRATPNACESVDFIVATAFTENGAALCTGMSDSQNGFGQRQCIDECVSREPTGNCMTDENGRVPRSCSPCAPSEGSGLKYCHEWVGQACSDAPGFENHGDCYDDGGSLDSSKLGTTKLLPKKSSPSANLTFESGSTCYVQIIRFFGRVYAYTSCTGKIVDLGPAKR